MRFHSAAAFLLAKGFGPSSNTNNEFALDVGVSTAPKTWGTQLKMALGDSDYVNSVAGAFNDLNEDWNRQDGEALDALKDISASFQQLAESDGISNLFQEKRSEGIAAAEESLDSSAPLAGSTFSPAHNQAIFTDSLAEEPTGDSYLESLKQTSAYSEASPAGSSGASYLEHLSAPVAAEASGTTAANVPSSYLDELQGATFTQGSYDVPATTFSPPAPTQPVAGAGSSYLDAMAQSPPIQSYAPPAAAATSGSYLDSMQGSSASATKAAASSEPAPALGASYLESIAGAFSTSHEEEVSGLSYPPAEPAQPVVDFAPDNEDAMTAGSAPKVRTVRYAKADAGFAPDNEDVMGAGSAPKVEAPQHVSRVRYVKQDPGYDPDSESWAQVPRPQVQEQTPRRMGTQKMPGFIPSLQGGQGMNGAANVPEPKPIAPRPVFSKKMSGIHSDFDEKIQPAAMPPPPNTNFVPKATPKAESRSIAAQRVKDIPDWQADFAHPMQDVTQRPQAPVSVFAKRVGGTLGADQRSEFTRPDPPMSVFSQKIKGTADFDGPQVQNARPEPPRSVFSQKIKGTADFNGPPPDVPKPEPRRSIFAQKIASNVPRAVAASSHGDFAANSNVPVPNPRAAPQQQQYGRAVTGVTATPGFAPDFSEAQEAGGIRSVPLPDYEQQNHQDRLTNMDHSFQVNPDNRIGSLQDEYLR